MRILVYDGGCPFCIATSGWLVRWVGPPAGTRRTLDEFDPATASRLRDAGFGNALAVIDTRTGEIRAGIDGILLFLGGTRRASLGRLAERLPGARWLLARAYRLVAGHRHILFPRRGGG